MSDLRVTSPAPPMAGSIGQGSAASAANAAPGMDPLGELLQLLQSMPAQLRAGTTQSPGSNVTDANGAPKLADSHEEFSFDSMLLVLTNERNKAQQAQMTTLTLGIKSDIKKQEAQTKRSIEKIKEWVNKFNDAAAKAKTSGILGWFKKIFTAVASALAVVAAGLLTAATGGAAAPLLAVATLALASSVVSIASDIVKANGGKGFDEALKYMDPGSLVGMGIGELAKELGASDAQASIVTSVFTVVATIAIMAAMVVLTGGSAAGNALEGLSKTLMTGARIGQAVAGAAGGATQAAQGAVNMSVAADTRDADLILGEQKDIDAAVAQLKKQIEEDHGFVKQFIDALLESQAQVSEIIRNAGDTQAQVVANMHGKGQAI